MVYPCFTGFYPFMVQFSYQGFRVGSIVVTDWGILTPYLLHWGAGRRGEHGECKILRVLRICLHANPSRRVIDDQGYFSMD
jgi:hypothetical protein